MEKAIEHLDGLYIKAGARAPYSLRSARIWSIHQ